MNSKGNVTFSGGEPTLYSEFLVNLTKALQEKDVHVSMETCGYFSINEKLIDKSTTNLKKLLSIIDLVIFDLKLFDDKEHKQYCGAGNRQIKENFTILAKQKLNQNKPGPDLSPLSEEMLKAAQDLLESKGITCYKPGEEDWSLI